MSGGAKVEGRKSRTGLGAIIEAAASAIHQTHSSPLPPSLLPSALISRSESPSSSATPLPQTLAASNPSTDPRSVQPLPRRRDTTRRNCTPTRIRVIGSTAVSCPPFYLWSSGPQCAVPRAHSPSQANEHGSSQHPYPRGNVARGHCCYAVVVGCSRRVCGKCVCGDSMGLGPSGSEEV